MNLSTVRPCFVNVFSVQEALRDSEHGGIGSIVFRRVLNKADFDSQVDFLDFTVIPPGSSIGTHRHVGNEELYYVVSGSPYVAINDHAFRCPKGTVTVVRHGDSHELVNDSDEPVEILVIQVSLPERTK